MPVNINKTDLPQLFFTMPESVVNRFVTVLQSGFYLPSTRQTTLRSFLLALPGFTEEYIATRLQTVFLNGDALDNFDIPFSEDYPVLALSAAMPGLAGAIFRKESIAAPLRKTVKHREDSNDNSTVQVRVKLFNNIAVERGPEIFAQGIIVSADDLAVFLTIRPSITDAMTNLTLNDISFASKELQSIFANNDLLFVTCRVSHG